MSYVDTTTRLKYRRTKIVATLGPSSSSDEVVRSLIEAGVNVFRLNMSHGDHKGHAANYDRVRRISQELDEPTAILADLCGPKIRVGIFPAGGIELEDGTEVTVTVREVDGEPGLIPSQYPGLADDVKPGQRIFLADGVMALQVISIDGPDVLCRVIAGGRLTDRKGINLPDSAVGAPCLTEKDRDDARFALDLGVEFLALSFVRQASDILELRQLIEDRGAYVHIVAKIERPEALKNIDEILDATDSIMVARGDLGVELPPEIVPVVQRDLLERARRKHRPAIVATQMLESMIENPRPTRAEVTDVSYSVTGGADAVMLSAETAAGKFPVDAVETMDKVTRHQEGFLWSHSQFASLQQDREDTGPMPFGQALSRGVSQLSRDLMVRAIFVLTSRGHSATEVISSRPAAPVVVVTPSENAMRRLNLSWGALPVQVDPDVLHDPVPAIRGIAIALGLAETGDTVLLVRGFHGIPEENLPSVTLIKV
jgi:pyruvate kinase